MHIVSCNPRNDLYSKLAKEITSRYPGILIDWLHADQVPVGFCHFDSPLRPINFHLLLDCDTTFFFFLRSVFEEIGGFGMEAGEGLILRRHVGVVLHLVCEYDVWKIECSDLFCDWND